MTNKLKIASLVFLALCMSGGNAMALYIVVKPAVFDNNKKTITLTEQKNGQIRVFFHRTVLIGRDSKVNVEPGYINNCVSFTPKREGYLAKYFIDITVSKMKPKQTCNNVTVIATPESSPSQKFYSKFTILKNSDGKSYTLNLQD